jgi:hypothetical protein
MDWKIGPVQSIQVDDSSDIASGFSITNKAGVALLWFGYTSKTDAAAARELIIKAGRQGGADATQNFCSASP